VTLLTAHKILIATAIAFFAFFALWELEAFRVHGDGRAIVVAILAVAVSVGFAIYLRGVAKQPHRAQKTSDS
jgi:hypothetical protein